MLAPPGRTRSRSVRARAAGRTRLDPPAPLGVPALVAEETGDRGEDVGRRGPDVAPAVAIAVDGVLQVVGGEELGLAAGAGPNLTLNPFDSAETVTGHIARISGGDLSYGSIQYDSIFALGLLLFAITLTLNIASRRIVARFREVYE